MKKILALVLAMILLCLSVLSVSAFPGSAKLPEEYSPYGENILNLIEEKYIPEDESHTWYYRQLYAYYDNIEASADEAEADYVLVEAFTAGDPMAPFCYIGKYVVRANVWGYPDIYNYYIYVADTNEVYTLKEAYELGVDGIDNAFTESGIASVVGDCDDNGKVNIKDATCVQKHLAGLEVPEIREFSLVYNYNRDEAINIKDATAIQKYLAGITE